MKAVTILSLAYIATALPSRAQGNFQYDQQSLGYPIPPNLVYNIQGNEPVGQSFTPVLPSVGFIQFELFDGHPNNGLGATLYVNLRSGSITGAVIASTSPVYMPEAPSGGGVTNFFFSGPVAVTPGTTYFGEVVVQSGDTWSVNIGGSYGNGSAYIQGVAQPFDDLWFREGVIIPEPSVVWLILAAGSVWFYVRRKSA